MILADTNIIIDFWRNPDDDMARVFASENVVICGVVKAELLHGARSDTDCRRILLAMEEFPCLELQGADWETLGHHLRKLRTHGVSVPFQDAVIATLAILHEASVWTNDKHFALMRNVLTELQLYIV